MEQQHTQVDTVYKCVKRTEKLNQLFNFLPKEEAIYIMYNSNHIAEFLEKIGERVGGSGYKRFYEYCKKYNINYNDYFKYEIKKPINLNKPIEQILVENSTYSNTNHLKKKLFKLKLLENKCAECGIADEWNGKKISLHMDHINGINNDNRLENLRILCPNCHSQTDTYCGRNRTETRERKKYYCEDCNVTMLNNCKRCKKCYDKNRRKVKDRPSKEELLELLKTNSFVSVGKMFNVSDNAIRKWLKTSD